MLSNRMIPIKMLVLLGMALAFTLPLTTSCSEDDSNPIINTSMFDVSGVLNAQSEVPPVISVATGSLSGTYDGDINLLTYSITWSNLTGAASAMHFHGPAAPGVSASPTLTIQGFPAAAAGSYSSQATLTEDQERQLLDGNWYLNIHTPTNPNGEIRGQVQTNLK
ncbi:CHRD domain-containing protein [Solitalea lacus]|uniref:CHRD domain-containing protein n=1 Tax=Solitalea lacus TaxID=2911172 RepID=UPI001EDBF09D|nr:CHRD domain-containing protein [Solitalea lacus]UKJ09219.1 CHRD domain-containing protein [Solitalea lacus]